MKDGVDDDDVQKIFSS